MRNHVHLTQSGTKRLAEYSSLSSIRTEGGQYLDVQTFNQGKDHTALPAIAISTELNSGTPYDGMACDVMII